MFSFWASLKFFSSGKGLIDNNLGVVKKMNSDVVRVKNIKASYHDLRLDFIYSLIYSSLISH